MSQTDLSSRLNQAVALINNGQLVEAHAMLIILSLEYPEVEQIWLWLAATSTDLQERIDALKTVLRLNPANEKAQLALAQLIPSRTDAIEDDSEEEGINSQKLLRALGLALILLVAFIIIRFIAAKTIIPLIVASPTATATEIPMMTRTPSVTFTPSITPGGPTATIYVQGTLPPTWTPSPSYTPAPTGTKRPSITPLPTRTPSLTVTPLPPGTKYAIAASPTPTPTGSLILTL